jgi:hypothetical protein
MCFHRFKGIWILDTTLDGLKVRCRPSQQKYVAPMKCMDPSQKEVDDAYETMEVCSFCKARDARLNVRAIQVRIMTFVSFLLYNFSASCNSLYATHGTQLLEYHAKKAKMLAKLEELLQQCLEDTFKSETSEAVMDDLMRNVEQGRQERLDSNDSHLITKMKLANVPHDEPHQYRIMSELQVIAG